MSRTPWSCLFWTLVLIASPVGAPHARAGEFDVVPLTDPLYKHLAAIQQSGLTGATEKGQTDAAGQALTRYEIALETAKAIFTVNSRNRTNSSWAATVARPTLRSLRELALAMRGELKTLDIDAAGVVQHLDTLLKPAPLRAAPLETPARSQPSVAGNARVTPRTPATPSTPAFPMLDEQSTVELPLSQRLRVQTVLSSLAREARDPLSKSPFSLARTGAALHVTPWLRLHAGQEHQLNRRGEFSLRSPLMNEADLINASKATVTGGGVDIAVRPGFTFSGNMARVAPESGDGMTATRLEGGLGLTGWQNRLVLSANISRLVPEDSIALKTTAAKLNLDVGLTEHLRVKLLYQQLFGAQQQRRADRVVAGGITINF